MLGNDPNDPASVVTSRESIRLALIAALQHLPARQRAVLVLRDVLRWKAAEVAEALDTSDSCRQQHPAARPGHARGGAARPRTRSSEPDDLEQRALLDRWVEAFWKKDVTAIVAMFSQDADLGDAAVRRLVPGSRGDRRPHRPAVPGRCARHADGRRPRPTASRRSVSTCAPTRATSSPSTSRCSRSEPRGSAMWRPSSTSICSRPSGCPRGCPTSLLPDHPSGSWPQHRATSSPDVPSAARGAGAARARDLLHAVEPSADLGRRHPRGRPRAVNWDLAALLHHMDDSLRALQDAADTGRVVVVPSEPDDPSRPRCLAEGPGVCAARCLDGTRRRRPRLGRRLSVDGVGAGRHRRARDRRARVGRRPGLRQRAAHARRPLAAALLPLVPVVVSEADRGSRFERAVAVPPWASPGDRLVAALGREPWRRTTSEAV